ncbi:MAG: pantoate--beta-alanine ligase [Deltaproteobacteria bacterium]
MSPRLIRSLGEYRQACDAVRSAGERVGLVPTLGALHPAHQSLMRAARLESDRVIVTIFVNPTQFGPGEDFERYPRDLSADLATCAAVGVDLVFAPERADMYPPGEATRVSVSGLTEGLCGPFRPGHFTGVATIVTKLFAATGACTAVFGRKDYQQLQVIRRLTRDLLLPVQIVEHPTERDPDGLAQSSRNRYLSAAERERALSVPRALTAVCERFAAGEHDAARLTAVLGAELGGAELAIEYAELATAEGLERVSAGLVQPRQVGAFVAVRVGNTRLIDNVILGVDRAPLASSHAPRVGPRS